MELEARQNAKYTNQLPKFIESTKINEKFTRSRRLGKIFHAPIH